LSTTGNKVAENGNKLLPETATLTGAATMLPFRQQFVAVFSNNCCADCVNFVVLEVVVCCLGLVKKNKID